MMLQRLLIALLLIALVLMAGMSVAQDELDEVTLKIMLPGDRPAQMDEIIAEAERRMAEEGLNIRLDVIFIPWADLGNISIRLAAGEEVDLVFDAPWLAFEQNVAQEFYIPLNDLLEEYGPTVWELRPEAMWEANGFDGVYYAVPLETQIGPKKAWQYRKDLADELGLGPIETLEDVEEFLYAVKENYPNIVPSGFGPDGPVTHLLYNHPDLSLRGYRAGLMDVLYFRGNDGILRNMFEERDPTFWGYVERVAQWRADGLLPPEIAPGDQYTIGAGGVALTPANDFGAPAAAIAQVEALGGELDWFALIDQSEQWVSGFIVGNLIAIPYSSRNPERAMMFLNWANDKENYDLLAYGIEGVHWEAVGDDQYIPNPDNLYRWYPFAWVWNPVHERLNAAALDGVAEWTTWNSDPDNFRVELLVGFRFNAEPVLAEVSELAALYDQYFKPLSFGVVDDIDAWWAEYEAAAGGPAARVQQEYQSQIDAFLAAQDE
jgi:putative aldouronate transport system substrate-binding protein